MQWRWWKKATGTLLVGTIRLSEELTFDLNLNDEELTREAFTAEYSQQHKSKYKGPKTKTRTKDSGARNKATAAKTQWPRRKGKRVKMEKVVKDKIMGLWREDLRPQMILKQGTDN